MSDQLSFSDAEQDAKRKKTRREVFLDEMKQVVPWSALEAVIEPHRSLGARGRRLVIGSLSVALALSA